MRDLGLAWRLFWRNPAFSILAVSTLALGLAATAAVFSVVQAVLLRDLPYPEPDRLVLVSASSPEGRRHFSPPDYLDLVEASRGFSAVAALQGAGDLGLRVGGEVSTARVAEVTAGFLSVYGLPPAAGRAFTADDAAPVAFERTGTGDVDLPAGAVMLGYEFWRDRFALDPAVIGRIVEIEDQPYRIIGVTPPAFRTLLPDEGDYTRFVDVWMLTRMPFATMPRDAAFLRVVGRLHPAADLGAARAEMAVFASRQRERHPRHADAAYAVDVDPLGDLLNARHATTLWMLFGAVALLMLIACANLVNLLWTRALARRTELAVRMALGSGRARLVRQLVTESLLYGLVAAALGVLMASGLVRVLGRLAPASIPRMGDVQIDAAVLGFAVITALAAAVIVAAVPAWRFTRGGEAGMLRGAGRTVAGARHTTRDVLVVAEVALAVVLVAGAVLFLRTVTALLAVDPGFRSAGVVTADVSLPSRRYPRYPRPDARVRFAQQLTERLERLPGVDAAALALVVPLGGQDAGHTWASEAMAAGPRTLPPAKYRPVTPGYFDVVQTRLVDGRPFTWDDVQQYRLVSIVDERLANRAWPGRRAIGQRLRIERWATNGGAIHLEPLWTEVVGVAENVRSTGLAEDDIETLYLPYGLYAVSELSVMIRTAAAPADAVLGLQGEISQVDRGLPLFNVRVMDQVIDDAVAPQRYSLWLVSAFGVVGLLLALVGVYGVLAQAVSLRRQEFAVRLALGADARAIARLVLTRGAALLALGIAAGLGLAVALSRAVASQLYGVSPADPVTYVAVSAFVLLAGLLASIVPARRAARTDPMTTLRLPV